MIEYLIDTRNGEKKLHRVTDKDDYLFEIDNSDNWIDSKNPSIILICEYEIREILTDRFIKG